MDTTPAPTLVSLFPCTPEACFSPGPSNDSILVAHAQPPSSPLDLLTVVIGRRARQHKLSH